MGDLFTLQVFQSIDVDSSRSIKKEEFITWATHNWIVKGSKKMMRANTENAPVLTSRMKEVTTKKTAKVAFTRGRTEPNFGEVIENDKIHEILRIWVHDLDKQVTKEEL